MPRLALSTLLLFAAALNTGCASWRLDRTAQAATGFASHVLCDEVFVSGNSPTAAFEERLRPLAGINAVAWAMSRDVNDAQREVRVRLAGGFESVARHRADTGCVSLRAGDEPHDASRLAGAPLSAPVFAAQPAAAPPADDPWGSAPVPAASTALRAVLEAAVSPGPADAPSRSKALVVLHEGQLLGEAYAPGVTPQTPLLAFSVSKSIAAALVGVLMQQGRLTWEQPAPIDAWADPADPRRAITVEHLLRQTSGLNLPQNNSGADATTRIMYGGVRDKAAAAAAAPLAAQPGTRWAYSDTNYMLLSRVLRNAVGVRPGDLQRFAQAELFAPAGMRQVLMDTDASGTPLLSSHLLMPARDLARFGQLLLDDGVAQGRRLLPEGFVARATTPTLATGYGAGLWTNRVPGKVPGWGAPWGLPSAPADTFFGRGFMGQFVVVVPSRRVVIVRMSAAPRFGDDVEEMDRLAAQVLSALGAGQP